MATKEYNFEILIRGQMRAYSKDELVDTFTDDGCYEMIHGAMRSSTPKYNGRIKVSNPDDSDPDVGYYNTVSYEEVLKKLAHRLYIHQMKSTVMDMKERVKAYDIAITALRKSKVGFFGDPSTIKIAQLELTVHQNFLNDCISTSEMAIKRIKYYDDIPNGDEKCLEQAKRILMELNSVFLIHEPTEEDTVGIVTGIGCEYVKNV